MRAKSAIFSRTSLSLCSARLLASSQWVPSSSRNSSAISSRLNPSRCADFTNFTRTTSASP
uniref:Putative mercuric resistance protein n=1 Tax=Shigella flexneri TaxID=623 RepID=MER_SHIFL|nr:RecName: Full=Putative mercuric resistance protein [Shigella flexneri]pir/S77978/ hypothetical protein, 6.5K - plasmid NR1 [Plasmid NR1]AAA92260.1 MerR [Escherichia coli]AAB59074.1 6.5 kd protein [Plasmid NR1]